MKNKSIPLPKIVSIDDIPNSNDVPLNNLINIFKVCTQLEKICMDEDGVGLHASQLGIPWKLFVVLYKDHYKYFVNCDYEGIGDKVKSVEGCLSLRNKDKSLRSFEVERYKKIILTGKELFVNKGKLEIKDIKKEMDGIHSIISQHEVDHNFGRERLISVIGKEVEISCR